MIQNFISMSGYGIFVSEKKRVLEKSKVASQVFASYNKSF